MAISVKYEWLFGKKLDLNDPKTFNEKLQWLKLYDRNPLYHTLVDKAEVKKRVADKIGEEYIIPTYGVYNSVDEIDFDAFPDQFVLKCTHDSASVIICKDKTTFDTQQAKQTLSECLKHKHYIYGREWVYKSINPRIIAEPYLEDRRTGQLSDYKFFCFNGAVRALFIATDRQSGREPNFDFYDGEGSHLNLLHGHPNASSPPALPIGFTRMKELASVLSEGIPQVRIDFYECNERIYFGEFTFFHHCGFVPFSPPEWDDIFGSYITLPKKKKKMLRGKYERTMDNNHKT